MKPLLLILLDAFNRDYLRHTPYLASLHQSQLQPMIGYNCTLASIFSGLSPAKHGFWNIFTLDQKTPRINKLLRLYSKFPSIHQILLRHGQNFSVSKSSLHTIPNIYPQPSIFDLLRQNNYPFLYYNHPWWSSHQATRFLPFPYSDSTAIKILGQKHLNKDFVFLHLYDLDRIGHTGNPHQTQSLLQHLDHQVKSITANWSGQIIIFSDHGMHPVKHTINPLPLVGRDLCFIESTMIRLWHPSQKTITKLKNTSGGRFLSAKEKRFYVPADSHGTHFWVLKKGFLLTPNFWNQRPVSAMHGYIDEPPVILLSNTNIPQKTHSPPDLYSLIQSLTKLNSLKQAPC